MLEVIDKGPCRESGKAPLLFVHGAWHGAWCWDEHFLDFFAAQGLSVAGREPSRPWKEHRTKAHAVLFDGGPR